MKNFGTIIRYYRTQSNLSMASLAEGICTKHYVYLIENGERIPSIKIIDELSAKLNFDWRDYVEYANMPSPIEAKELIDRFGSYNKAMDIKAMADLLNNLPDEPWLKSYPINIEILVQKVNLGLYAGENKVLDYEEAKEIFTSYIISKVSKEDYSVMPVIFLKALNIYASMLISQNENDDGFLIFKKLLSALEAKKEMTRYQDLYISVYHNIISYYEKTGDYNKMHSHGVKLMKFQENKCLIEKLPMTIIFIGDAHKYLKNRTLAYKYYKRAITISQIIKSDHLSEIAKKHITRLYHIE